MKTKRFGPIRKAAAALGAGLAIMFTPVAAQALTAAPGVHSATVIAAPRVVAALSADDTGLSGGWNGIVAVSPPS